MGILLIPGNLVCIITHRRDNDSVLSVVLLVVNVSLVGNIYPNAVSFTKFYHSEIKTMSLFQLTVRTHL